MSVHVPAWRARLEAARPAFVERSAQRCAGLTDPAQVERILREEVAFLLHRAGLATEADAAREDQLDYAAALALAELDRLTGGR